MLIKNKEIVLKNGQKVELKSTNKENAKALCNHRYKTATESYFMARYPEEINSDVKVMEDYLIAIENDKKDFMITAFLNGEIIGDAGVTKIRNHIKYRHRGYFGISILKEYCGLGLGKQILELALKQAKDNEFEQLELGVFEDNNAGINLYESCGFKRIGIQPKAFKLKDGTYRDEILMACFLKK